MQDGLPTKEIAADSLRLLPPLYLLLNVWMCEVRPSVLIAQSEIYKLIRGVNQQ